MRGYLDENYSNQHYAELTGCQLNVFDCTELSVLKVLDYELNVMPHS
jgi:hypothetical protein